MLLEVVERTRRAATRVRRCVLAGVIHAARGRTTTTGWRTTARTAGLLLLLLLLAWRWTTRMRWAPRLLLLLLIWWELRMRRTVIGHGPTGILAAAAGRADTVRWHVVGGWLGLLLLLAGRAGLLLLLLLWLARLWRLLLLWLAGHRAVVGGVLGAR